MIDQFDRAMHVWAPADAVRLFNNWTSKRCFKDDFDERRVKFRLPLLFYITDLFCDGRKAKSRDSFKDTAKYSYVAKTMGDETLRGDIFYKNWVIHNDSGPAFTEDYAGTTRQAYFKNGLLHRLDGPAIEGKLHTEWFVEDRWLKGFGYYARQDRFVRYISTHPRHTSNVLKIAVAHNWIAQDHADAIQLARSL